MRSQAGRAPLWILRLRAQGADAAPVLGHELREHAVREVGPGALAWAAGSAERLLAAMNRDAAPSGVRVPDRGGVETELVRILVHLAEGGSADLDVSDDALADAALLGRVGAPGAVVSEAVWRMHAHVQQAVLAPAPGGIPDGSVLEALARLTRYSAGAARRLLEAHAEAAAVDPDRGPGLRRRAGLGRLLRGDAVTADDEAALGLRTGGQHLMAVVSTSGGRSVAEDDGELVDVVHRVDRAVPGTTSLTVRLTSETVVWWARSTAFEPAELDRIARVAVPGDLVVAFGDPHGGSGGIARGYAEARRAASVARSSATRVPSMHADALLTAAVLADRDAALALVTRELGGVLGTDERTVELRRTVLAFLRSGGSRQESASELGIAPTTVAYRIDRFEQLRGRRLREARLETWAALDVVDRAPVLLETLAQGVARASG